jgi:hypothetical protein
MNLDLRIPMGWMFTLMGLLLSFFGLSTNGKSVLYDRSLGINVNLWWGLALLAFGLIMLELGRRGQKRTEKESHESTKEDAERRGH